MRTSSRKLLVILAGVILAGFVVYQSGGFIHKANFSAQKLLHAVAGANLYLLLLCVVVIYVCYGVRALRWQLFQGNLGSSRFWIIYKMTLAGFADMFGIYALERVFDFASTAVITALALLFFQSHVSTGETSTALGTAAKTAGSALCAGVTAAVVLLVYLRLRGTAALERGLEGWVRAPGWRRSLAGILLGFVRGVQAVRNVSQLLLAIFYSALHWFLVLLVYYWGSRSFGGRLGALTLRDVMLVMAFSLVGSVVQLPAVGGGAQLASALVFTKIFGVETEPATAAAVVLWLIGFAACSLAGVPFLIQEGLSLGKLR